MFSGLTSHACSYLAICLAAIFYYQTIRALIAYAYFAKDSNRYYRIFAFFCGSFCLVYFLDVKVVFVTKLAFPYVGSLCLLWASFAFVKAEKRSSNKHSYLTFLGFTFIAMVFLFIGLRQLTVFFMLANLWYAMKLFVREEKELVQKVGAMEAEVQQIAKAAEVAFIAGNISHDVRNPLALVLANAYRLEKTIEQTEDPMLQKPLAKIIRGAERIEKIVDNYFAVLKTGNEKKNREEIAFSSLIANAILLCEHRIQKTKIAFFDVDIANDLYICGNENELVMIFVNMIANACDAISHLEERWIKINCESKGDKIHLRVMDSGQGIPFHLRQFIFDKHFTTKNGREGFGLGLDFVKKVVEAHNGQVLIDDKQIHTCFLLEFPRVPQAKNQVA